MSVALIGHTGFVGTSLKRQASFEHLFNSGNIDQVAGQPYESVICSAAPAQKWIANRDPEADWANIQALIKSLDSLTCAHFTLISTVDVFAEPVGVDESTTVRTEGLHAYGLNRFRLEQFVQERFASHLIVRLPGLVGPGLRKNILFDFHNDNNIAAIDSRSSFQFYPMVNLHSDIQAALGNGIKMLHLTSEPVTVADVAREAFNIAFDNVPEGARAARYDMRSIHAHSTNEEAGYQYARQATMLAIRAYHQSEPLLTAAAS
ncbi:pyridine nucleotide transhydrogenase [Stenotrophomonas maltophilia]|nr:NAD(P)-dependent oxidoreductase [Stenotrophomonas maltophilia]